MTTEPLVLVPGGEPPRHTTLREVGLFTRDSSGEVVPLDLATTFAAAAGAALGSRVVTLGDSITIGAEAHTSANESLSGSWPAYAGWLSGQRFRVVKNAGVGGDKTSQMLVRFDSDVTPYAPTMVVISGGANDIAQGIVLAEFQANIRELVARCRTIGARPVLTTIPPNNAVGRAAPISAWNIWLRMFGLGEGIPVLDFNRVLTDPATGVYLAAYNSGDGTHPSVAGYAAMGKYVSDVLTPLLGEGFTPLPTSNVDPSNLLGNACFMTDATGDGLADGWVKTGPGTWVPTLEPAAVGNWQQFVTSGTVGSGTGLNRGVAGSASPGDKVRFCGLFDTTGPKFAAQVSVAGTTFYYRAAHDIPDARAGAWDVEFTAPAGATGLSVSITAGIGTHKVAQVGLYNLTRLGLA